MTPESQVPLPPPEWLGQQPGYTAEQVRAIVAERVEAAKQAEGFEARMTSDTYGPSVLDEIVGFGHVHLEQMSDGHWWLGLGDDISGRVIVNLTARGQIKATATLEGATPKARSSE